jgi:hypothetical protein
MAIVHSWKESEDALPRGIRQDGCVETFLLESILAVEHPKEERLVADYRAAKTGRILVPVEPDRVDTLPVIRP